MTLTSSQRLQAIVELLAKGLLRSVLWPKYRFEMVWRRGEVNIQQPRLSEADFQCILRSLGG